MLQSSDGVLFRVHKSILAAASGFFQSMFALPQGEGQQNSPMSSVTVTETSATLSFLLASIYPHLDQPSITSYDEVREVVAAAQKYGMPRVVSLLRLGRCLSITILSQKR